MKTFNNKYQEINTDENKPPRTLKELHRFLWCNSLFVRLFRDSQGYIFIHNKITYGLPFGYSLGMSSRKAFYNIITSIIGE